MAALPPVILQAGCPLRVIQQAIISQQICASNNLIPNSLKDMSSAKNLVSKKITICAAKYSLVSKSYLKAIHEL
jgi:hypothetical protein